MKKLFISLFLIVITILLTTFTLFQINKVKTNNKLLQQKEQDNIYWENIKNSYFNIDGKMPNLDQDAKIRNIKHNEKLLKLINTINNNNSNMFDGNIPDYNTIAIINFLNYDLDNIQNVNKFIDYFKNDGKLINKLNYFDYLYFITAYPRNNVDNKGYVYFFKTHGSSTQWINLNNNQEYKQSYSFNFNKETIMPLLHKTSLDLSKTTARCVFLSEIWGIFFTDGVYEYFKPYCEEYLIYGSFPNLPYNTLYTMKEIALYFDKNIESIKQVLN